MTFSLKGGSSLLAVLLLASCATKHQARVEIPANCVKIEVTSFRKPCVERADGTYVCDEVVIRANCVRAVKR